MITRTVTPDADTLFAALERLPQDEPVVMLNLLQFREQALYADGGGQGSGRDAYRRYGERVFPMLEKIGASVKRAGSRMTADATNRYRSSPRDRPHSASRFAGSFG